MMCPLHLKTKFWTVVIGLNWAQDEKVVPPVYVFLVVHLTISGLRDKASMIMEGGAQAGIFVSPFFYSYKVLAIFPLG